MSKEQQITRFEVDVRNGNFNLNIEGTVGKNAYIALHNKDTTLSYNNYVIYYYLNKIFDYEDVENSQDFPLINISGTNWLNYAASSGMKIVIWDSTPTNHTIDAQYIYDIPKYIPGIVKKYDYSNDDYVNQHLTSFDAYINNNNWNVHIEGIFHKDAWVAVYQSLPEENKDTVPTPENYNTYSYITSFGPEPTDIKDTALKNAKGDTWFSGSANTDCYFVIWDYSSSDLRIRYWLHIPRMIEGNVEKNYKMDISQHWWCQTFSWEQEQQIKQAVNKRAAFQKGTLWESGKVLSYSVFTKTPSPASYSNEPTQPLPPEQTTYNDDHAKEKIIDEAFAEWNRVGMSISFKKIDIWQWKEADIRIELDPNKVDRSEMGIGARDISRDEATMNLGMRKGLGKVGYVTALHEIGHAIGLVHEHQRVDSEIKWNKEGVYKYFAERKPIPVTDKVKIDNNVFAIDKIFENFPGGQFAYDPKSVMNYDFPAMCFEAPDELKINGIQRSENLTETDKASARLGYPKLHDES